MKLNIRIALLRKLQIDPRWRQVGEMTTAIYRQIVGTFALEFFELLIVFAFHPAHGMYIDRLV